MIGEKYRDHAIRFDEAEEEWKCDALVLSDKSLAKLKLAIDKAAKEKRRVDVPALHLHETGGWRSSERGLVIRPCTITLLREDGRKATIRVGKKADQVALDELYPLEERAKLEAYVAAKKREQAIEREVQKLEEKLDRMTAEMVREAVARQADEEA